MQTIFIRNNFTAKGRIKVKYNDKKKQEEKKKSKWASFWEG